jgi:putative transcriptional regulator
MTRLDSKLAIGNHIPELRRARGFTQEQLADAIGVTRATVLAMEKGNYNPSLELAFRLAKFFKIGVENIFFEKGTRRE